MTAAALAAVPDPDGWDDDPRPVVHNQGNSPATAALILHHLASTDDTGHPHFVVYGGVLSAVDPERADGTLEPLSLEAIQQEAAVHVRVEVPKSAGKGKGTEWVEADPTPQVLKVMQKPRRRALRQLIPGKSLPAEVELALCAPFVRPDGSICATPGVDPATGVLLVMPAELAGCVPAANLTQADAIASVEWITTELLGDFPLARAGDRANAYAALLTPGLRPMVELAPFFAVDSSTMGAGKGELVDMVATAWTGRPAVSIKYPDAPNSEEGRKLITAVIATSPVVVKLDEANLVGGPAMQKLATDARWSDRILGGSTMGDYPNRTNWFPTGNNITLVGDMARRVVRLRMEPTVARPWRLNSSEFRHPRLREWVAANRADVLRHLLTPVAAWHAAGRPAAPHRVTLGSFSKWSETLSDVLAFAGVDGFLSTFDEDTQETSPDTEELGAFLAAVASAMGSQDFTAHDLALHADAIRTADALPGWVEATVARHGGGMAQAIGQYLYKHRGRWAELHDGTTVQVVRREHADRAHRPYWHLERRRADAEAVAAEEEYPW